MRAFTTTSGIWRTYTRTTTTPSSRASVATKHCYHEIYAGLNYFLYGHKLKWPTGIQYVTMDDHADDGGEYSGWQFVTGIRIGW